jgi:hypothetical protein
MDWKSILQISAGLLGGGAMGAILRMLYDIRQNQVPQVHYGVDDDRIFSTTGSDGLKAKVSVEHEGVNFNFENVSLVKIWVKNRSRHDHSSFVFGITLPERSEVFKYDGASKDRYHVLACQQSPTPADLERQLDFTATPY